MSDPDISRTIRSIETRYPSLINQGKRAVDDAVSLKDRLRFCKDADDKLAEGLLNDEQFTRQDRREMIVGRGIPSLP